jgi:gluconate kinase
LKSGDDIDDYFSAFKVANVEKNVEGLEKDDNDKEYWAKLIGKEVQEKQR